MKIIMKMQINPDDELIQQELQRCVELGLTEEEASDYIVGRIDQLFEIKVTSVTEGDKP